MHVYPFNRFLIGLAAISNSRNQLVQLIRYYNLPQLTDYELQPFYKYIQQIKVIKTDQFKDFYQHFVKKNINIMFVNAINIQRDPILYRVCSAAIILNKADDFLGVKIKPEIINLFKHYFMDISVMDIFNWNNFIKKLPALDQQLFYAALDQDEPQVKWLLGQIPVLARTKVVDDVLSISYYQFLEHIRFKQHDMAIKYAELCLKAVDKLPSDTDIDEYKQFTFKQIFRDRLEQLESMHEQEMKAIDKGDNNGSNKSKLH